MLDYKKRYSQNHTQIEIASFDFFTPESQFEQIEAYFKQEMKSDLNDVIRQENTILIIDEAQNIFHINQFWALFKGKESLLRTFRYIYLIFNWKF